MQQEEDIAKRCCYIACGRGKKNRKNTPRQKINSMNEIAEDVEITKTGEI